LLSPERDRLYVCNNAVSAGVDADLQDLIEGVKSDELYSDVEKDYNILEVNPKNPYKNPLVFSTTKKRYFFLRRFACSCVIVYESKIENLKEGFWNGTNLSDTRAPVTCCVTISVIFS